MAAHLTPSEKNQYDENVQPQNLAGLIICLVISVVALALRMYSQWLVGGLKKADSLLAVVAFVSSWLPFHNFSDRRQLLVLLLIIANILALNGGGGLHIVSFRIYNG